MKTQGTYVFIGGCSGTANPYTSKVTSPSLVTNKPLAEPISRDKFGIHTTAFGIVIGKTGIFIDNGTGVGAVAQFILSQGATTVYGLQTHIHADHCIGIYNNSLLFKKDLVKQIVTPKLSEYSFQDEYDHDFDTALWPISPEKVGVTHTISEFEPGVTLSILDGIETLSLNHPGGAVAYRIHLPEGDVVIATDHELVGDHVKKYAEFVSGARFLYADVQYRDSEYAGEKGICGGPAFPRKTWGHSTPTMLGEALSHCEKVPTMVIVGHHDPSRSDSDLESFEEEIEHAFVGLKCTVRLARDNDTFKV